MSGRYFRERTFLLKRQHPGCKVRFGRMQSSPLLTPIVRILPPGFGMSFGRGLYDGRQNDLSVRAGSELSDG